VLHVPGANSLDKAGRVLRRPLGLRPELVLVEVVALRETGAVLCRLGAGQAAGASVPGQRAAAPPERLRAGQGRPPQPAPRRRAPLISIQTQSSIASDRHSRRNSSVSSSRSGSTRSPPVRFGRPE